MTAATPASRRARAVTPRSRRRLGLMLRRGLSWETRLAILLAGLATVFTVAISLYPGDVPLSSLMLPLLLGSLFLGPRSLPWFVIFVMVMLTISISLQNDNLNWMIGLTTLLM